MATWLEMVLDEKIADGAEITAPTGEKVTMGQIREAYLARENALAKDRESVRTAQKELADVFQILQQEKVAIEAAREEIRNKESQLQNLENTTNPTRAEEKRMEALEKEIGVLKDAISKSHKNQVEIADIWLDEKYERVVEKYGSELPEGIDRNQLIRFAQQNSIKDRRGVIDLDAAAKKIVEPKRTEKMIKEAEERGAQRAREEATMASMGAGSSFGPRGSQSDQGAPKKFATLDQAFAEAAKDATVWMPPTVQ